MFEKFRPLGDRVLVQLIEEESRTASGLYIPDAAKEKTQRGRVVAIGNGRRDNNGVLHPLEVKVGEQVFFGKYSGSEANKGHMIIREDEILGIVE